MIARDIGAVRPIFRVLRGARRYRLPGLLRYYRRLALPRHRYCCY